MNPTFENATREMLIPDAEAFREASSQPWRYVQAATTSIDRLNSRRWIMHTVFGVLNLFLVMAILLVAVPLTKMFFQVFLAICLGILLSGSWLCVLQYQIAELQSRRQIFEWIERDLNFRPVTAEQSVTSYLTKNGMLGTPPGISRVETHLPVIVIGLWSLGMMVFLIRFSVGY